MSGPHPAPNGAHGANGIDKDFSAAVEDYAKAIYSLAERGDGTVTTNALAERLGVTAASASGMVRKLAEFELVLHEPYHGVSLTPRGTALALEVLRHHRLLELFLHRSLGVPWDEVHDEAERLEHAMSEQLEERIANFLGEPTHDPHGDPIPSRDLVIPPQDVTQSLDALQAGERGRFVRVSDADPQLLRDLGEKGIAPGATFEIVARSGKRGTDMTVRFGEVEHAMPVELARAMRVSYA